MVDIRADSAAAIPSQADARDSEPAAEAHASIR